LALAGDSTTTTFILDFDFPLLPGVEAGRYLGFAPPPCQREELGPSLPLCESGANFPLRAKVLIGVHKKQLPDAIEAIYHGKMQLEREYGAPEHVQITARDVAEYVAAMAEEIADMARAAGLDALARSLEETNRVARAALCVPSSRQRCARRGRVAAGKRRRLS
jgi:hypothetical protein